MGAVKDLASAVWETQLDARGLMALTGLMSEKSTSSPALRTQKPVTATQQLPASSTVTPSTAQTETDGASNPATAGEAAGRYLPHTNSHALCACRCGDRSRATRTIKLTSATATGPAPRHGEADERCKKVERKPKGEGKEKKGWDGRRGTPRPD